jgi:hypothetical protein
MIIFCTTCRSKLVRTNGEWHHQDGSLDDGHAAKPLAARRCRLFDPDVVGLPGYDRALGRLVERERIMGGPLEIWRLGLYVFDGRVRGTFRYATEASQVPPRSLFQPPREPSRGLLRDHPIVKERLAPRPPRA